VLWDGLCFVKQRSHCPGALIDLRSVPDRIELFQGLLKSYMKLVGDIIMWGTRIQWLTAHVVPGA
jgi:hypothetical protein